MSIKIITTGGTIDKNYNFLIQNISLGETRVPKMLDNGRCRAEVFVEKIFKKYSTEIKKSDLEKIVKACKNAKQKQIIITHGTDKMIDTAKVLAQKHINKTIILTGSIIPDAMENSDAAFNLGGAIIAVQTLATGVYIVINGKVFAWDKAKKDKKKKEFVGI